MYIRRCRIIWSNFPTKDVLWLYPDCLTSRAYGAVMKIRREIRDSQSDVCVLVYLLIRARITRLWSVGHCIPQLSILARFTIVLYSPVSQGDCDYSRAERRPSVADISSHRPWFDLKLVRLGFVRVCTSRLNTQKFHVLPTQCIYVFYVDLRTNSDYFPIQH